MSHLNPSVMNTGKRIALAAFNITVTARRRIHRSTLTPVALACISYPVERFQSTNRRSLLPALRPVIIAGVVAVEWFGAVLPAVLC
jgi:hypothetical protein